MLFLLTPLDGMTPYLGKGATNAIVDGMALAEALEVAEDKKELVPQLAEYEKFMVKRGFAAAKESMLVHHLLFAAGSTPWRAWFRNIFLYMWDFFTSHPPNPKDDPFLVCVTVPEYSLFCSIHNFCCIGADSKL